MRVEGLLTFPKEAWELDCNYSEPALSRGQLAYGKCIPLLPFIFSSHLFLSYSTKKVTFSHWTIAGQRETFGKKV